MSIIDLPKKVAALSPKDRELFDRYYAVHEATGILVMPNAMKPWADKAFGSHKDLERQKVVKTYNKFTCEGALFNEVRARRPKVPAQNQDVLKEIKDTEGGPFCKPLTGTPADSFGRIKGKHCVTASNVAKYDALHGLIIFKKHNPLDFNEKEVQDYFRTAEKWLKAAHKENKDAKYPFILWNCLWRAAASIVHGHMQVLLGSGENYGEAEMYNWLLRDNPQYFEELYRVHESVGLGLMYKDVKVFMSLNPMKDKEVTVVGERIDRDFVNALYKAVRCLIDGFGMESFNVGIMMPPLEKNPEWKGFPVVARVVDRLRLSSKTTDFGGCEIYAGTPVIETDPYRVMEELKKRF